MPKRKSSVKTKARKRHAKGKRRKELDAESHRLRRTDPEAKNIISARAQLTTKQRKKDASLHRKSRKDPEFRRGEKIRDAFAHRVKNKISLSTYENLRNAFDQEIRQAPIHVCSCCGTLWYKASTVKTSVYDLSQRGLEQEMISSVLSVNQEQHLICMTCRNSIYKKKIPKMSLSNGFSFPELPAELTELSSLEERLVSPRLPFLTIRPAGFEMQSVLRGNIVNVENNLDICAAVLPRNFNEASTVQVKLMRRMSYKVPYMFETIRPKRVYDAARNLISSELYRNHGITLCSDWSNHAGGDWSEFGADDVLNFLPRNESESDYEENLPENELDQPIVPDDVLNSLPHNETQTVGVENQPENELDLHIGPGKEREEFDFPVGADDTILFRQNDPSMLGIRIAPAEGKTPIPLFQDPDAEILSFPSIYGGIPRIFDPALKISYTDIVKSEIRRYDRRACKPAKLLYSFKKSFNEKVRNAVHICTRKKMGNVSAQKAKDPAFIERLIKNDDGYAVFKHLRSSPSYWQEKGKTLNAMMCQLGASTFFMSLSAAETKWAELIVTLSKVVSAKTITEEEAKNMTFDEISEIIRNDPVTCMRQQVRIIIVN